MRLTRTVVMLFLMASILIHAICCDELTDSIARDGRSLAARLSQDAGRFLSGSPWCLLLSWYYLFIFIWFLPIYTDVCEHCILNTYPSSVKKKSQAYYSGGIRTQDLCNSRALSYWVKSADTHRCIWVKKKCKFFIPDANLTSMICSLFVITVTWHFPFFIVTFFNDSSFIFLHLY